MTAKEKGSMAKNYFLDGYNCAQSVLLAFCDETGFTKRQAAKLASSFGGGMGRMREVCGAVSSMFMIIGLLKGYDNPAADEEKKAAYERVRMLADRFKEDNGSIICRDLLQDVAVTPGGEPEARTQAYYQRRPCACYVEDAARIVAEQLGM
jgi:C_GCAxxG_C_C family probable redox protein